MNAFLDFADKKMTRAHKRRLEKLVVQSEKEAPMVLSPMERDQRDSSIQFRKYEKWRREKRDAVFAVVDGLQQLIGALTPAQAQGVLEFFRARDWSQFDAGTRHDILSVIDDAITKMRVQHGMPPMDDSLPGQPPRVFEVVRKILTGVGQ